MQIRLNPLTVVKHVQLTWAYSSSTTSD